MGTPGTARAVVGWAAWDVRDVADARRRRPDVDLTAWAADRGFDAHGSANAGGWAGVLPGEPELQANVVRGTTPGGWDCCLWHWREPVPVADGPQGPTLRGRPHHDLTVQSPLRGLPRAGGRRFVGVPVTAAAVAVPEAALLAPFTLGAPDPDAPAAQPVPGLLPRLLAGPLGAVVAAGSRFALFELAWGHGVLVLRRNGYAGPAGVDELLAALDVCAAALAEVCAPLHTPAPFARPLPAVAWPTTETATGCPWPPSPLLEEVHRLSRRLDMQLEDPDAYHRTFPTTPVPGRAWAVLRGALPVGPATSTARIALHTDAPLPAGGGRTALLVGGPYAPTPPGGVRLTGSPVPMRYAVRGEALGVWVLRDRPPSLGAVTELLGTGLALASGLRLRGAG
ncbi:hypothetical protein FHX36_003182 [Modestobacter versicolor]|uniref:Uncharacterized protein n=1 Tax=Modestobacter versicolor TaxID=429133 RepID=A0A839Y4T7_9ACTN|nr:hypothetical protein [Modestobacter versicolor]MBB3677447.1 hypothetical protein [Modestobacter versicolor]